MKKYDVIIVGCGPSGVAAAKVLKDNNINFCIIEKNKFPREKLCAGGLTIKSSTLLKELKFDISNINTFISKDVNIIGKNVDKTIPLDNAIIMTDRVELDYNNLKQVINNNYFEEETITNIEDNILITDKDKYEFKYIIFADGVNGYSRKLISNRKFGFCVEYNSKTKIDKTILDFSCIDYGYGWTFPKAKHTTIGLIKYKELKDNYVDLLCSFADKYKLEIDKSKVHGYHIPIFSKDVYKKSVIDNKYILVGDAASLVDNVSGEGIYYALYSGMKAAESIIACINDNQVLSNIYFEKTKKIYKKLRRRNNLSKLLYSKYSTFFIKLGLSNKLFIKYLNRLFG